MQALNAHPQADEQEREPVRRRSDLLLAIGLVAAAAALVLAVLPQPQLAGCSGAAACAAASPRRSEVVAVVQEADASAPTVAEVFRTIRSADAEGRVPPIPPSETWPAQ